MTGQSTHPDADVLAEYRAGLVTRRRAATITAHLADCARCTGVADDLASVPALLATVPAPAMPDRLAQRLDLELAAEVARRIDSERPGVERPRDPVTRRRPTRNRGLRRMSLRVLAPAAAVVLAVGGYFLSRIGGTPQQGASSAAAPASSARPATGRVAAPLGAPATAGGTEPQSQRMSPADFAVVISPFDFRATALSQQLEADLRMPVTTRPTHAASTTVRACVLRVAGSAAVVRVESARFEGQPATVIVTRAGASASDQARIVGADCSAASSDVLATATVPAGIS